MSNSALPAELVAVCAANGISEAAMPALSEFYVWFKSNLESNAELRAAYVASPDAVLEAGFKFYEAQMREFYAKLLSGSEEGNAMMKQLAGEVYDAIRAANA